MGCIQKTIGALRISVQCTQKLQKYWRHSFPVVFCKIFSTAKTMSVLELVTRHQPILFDEIDKPIDCTVMSVEQNGSQTNKLAGSIPTVATVHDDALATFHQLRHTIGS